MRQTVLESDRLVSPRPASGDYLSDAQTLVIRSIVRDTHVSKYISIVTHASLEEHL